MKNRKDHIPFYIITGGPGVGKTTVLQEFKKRGYEVVPEIARELIKEQQAMEGEALPWKDKKRYVELMFQRSVESFEQVIKNFQGKAPVFFDRGFLDALCYASLAGIHMGQEMITYADTKKYNAHVFILPPWKDIYRTDAQRKQGWNEAVFSYNTMIQTYRRYDYELVEVPLAPVHERADFILEHIESHG